MPAQGAQYGMAQLAGQQPMQGMQYMQPGMPQYAVQQPGMGIQYQQPMVMQQPGMQYQQTMTIQQTSMPMQPMGFVPQVPSACIKILGQHGHVVAAKSSRCLVSWFLGYVLSFLGGVSPLPGKGKNRNFHWAPLTTFSVFSHSHWNEHRYGQSIHQCKTYLRWRLRPRTCMLYGHRFVPVFSNDSISC